ncbi:nucleotidyltransferase substrate binding protein, HI0074 family [Marivirga sericea]|uniref:Nucleotidyltransferase substrate binding protein, HI0074 family n=1 Tax=Marivirga sericea TaxID=1028 RepID=A0A1X7KXS9_9BACT|nr:nucleotidyltransferase substrate binding protein [Marivirga sericea]SMG46034.1 nucleotidyltransferase substrate binding protein, HI0074 family [Marivirga sericea]
MGDKDIRWIQRFSNFNKAFSQLEKAVQLSEERELTDLEEQGLIQLFECNHELAWQCLKDFIQEKGNSPIYGSKDATREAFQLELISDGEGWMEMIKSRNESSNAYNSATAETIAKNIKGKYFTLFQDFKLKMKGLIADA